MTGVQTCASSDLHKGLEARHIAVKAREAVSKDLTTIVGNEIVDFLGAIL